ncbi:hypothetical protein BDW22DRAFT_1121225 [Trametopsis cervina]|nr:hypothetical protein BDW22DRAFT_1121225 [Trametopsis cervina]
MTTTNKFETIPLPSGFAIIQALSESVVKHWPPSTIDPAFPPDLWSSPYDTALQALQSLQNDIAITLHKTARAIEAARNSASPALKLPVEVLRHVFAALGGNVRDKLAVSHTCNVWRETILHDPFLWTTVDLDTIKASQIASRVFRRAKEYPLQLSCRHWDALRIKCAVVELARVEELDVTFTVAMFHDLCRRKAPLLKRCKLTVPDSANTLTYLPCLFSKAHPRLTDLTMNHCRLIFNTENYRGLTKLDIRFSLHAMPLRQDEDFSCMFRACPDLEELRLEQVNLSREVQESYSPIHLAKLRTMRLHLSMRDLNCLLSAISAPPTLQLSILTYNDGRGRAVSPISAPTQPCLSLLTETRFLDADEVTSTVFAFREEDYSQPSLSYKVLGTEKLTPVASEALIALSALHFMPHLYRLRTRDIEPDTIITLLKHCPSICTLELIYSNPDIGDSTIIPRLAEELEYSEGRLFPSLRCLKLERVYLDVETLFNLTTISKAAPKLHTIECHSCQGDLQVTEMIEILNEDFEVVNWTSRSLVTEALSLYNASTILGL